MDANIVRHQRTSQEFAFRLSTENVESALIAPMRDFFANQGRRLVAVRIACTGQSQTAWADELGLSKSYVNELENNKKDLSLEVARKIKGRWHLPLDFLLDGDLEMLDQAPARIVRKLEELAA